MMVVVTGSIYHYSLKTKDQKVAWMKNRIALLQSELEESKQACQAHSSHSAFLSSQVRYLHLTHHPRIASLTSSPYESRSRKCSAKTWSSSRPRRSRSHASVRNCSRPRRRRVSTSMPWRPSRPRRPIRSTISRANSNSSGRSTLSPSASTSSFYAVPISRSTRCMPSYRLTSRSPSGARGSSARLTRRCKRAATSVWPA